MNVDSDRLNWPGLGVQGARPSRSGAVRGSLTQSHLMRCYQRRRPTVSSLSSEVSSAHAVKQRHCHLFPTPSDPALTIGMC